MAMATSARKSLTKAMGGRPPHQGFYKQPQLKFGIAKECDNPDDNRKAFVERNQ
jgi:hypothetical protein